MVTATACASERIPKTVVPGTMLASATCGSGTITVVMPRSRAASTIGSTPRTERRLPSSISSPTYRQWRSISGSTAPSAPRTASAMPRSWWVPRLRRSAGESSTVIRFVLGHGRSELVMAIRTRSRASLSDWSTRPTRSVRTMPAETSACTVTTWPTAPSSETVLVVATGIRPAP